MNSKVRSDLIKLTIFFVVASLITVSVIATLLDLKLGQPQTSYHAVFTNASGLQAGDTVRIAGVEVGKVNGVSLTRDNQVRVDFTVASSDHLTTHALASIQFENLLGQRYLQVAQGRPGGAPLHSGATLPETNTKPGLDLTTVFTGFQPLLAALNPTQVNQLTGSIIAVLQGESGAVGNLINQTASLTSNLASRQALITQILDNLTPLLTNVNHNDTQLSSLIDGLNTLVTGLAGQRQQIGAAVSGLSTLTTNTSNLLNNVQPTLDQDLGGLRDATGVLLANQSQLDSVIKNLPGLFNALDKASSSGSYLSVYICDLTIQTSGPISVKLSPGVPQSPAISVPTGLVGNQAVHTRVCQS
ncbi:MAG TPA: MlaD family protein [Acidimicrobiales bacterium]|nr:MlaD family protein [Acidimicrobiales bacterium]